MSLSEIASILQIGFSGFAFLLAGMSYRLLRAESAQKGSGRKTILGSIHRYTNYTLAVAIIALVASLSEKGLSFYFEYQKMSLKQRQAATTEEALSCRGAIDRLISAETKVNHDYPSLLQAIQEASANCNNTLAILGDRRE